MEVKIMAMNGKIKNTLFKRILSLEGK